jgi:UDP-2-acetamido-3-amino-2,3-dideoxy-glucuronate N-acetyltransferase
LKNTSADQAVTEYSAHPSAVIDDGCTIGKGSKIWHFSHLMPGSVIGEDCNIGQNVVISPGVVLGNNVKVQNNVSIYTGVTCEDDVFLGPSCVFTNVINPRSAVPRKNQYARTIVRRGASIGANATIVCGHEIGEYAFIGAGAVVTREVPAFALVMGNPARQTGWMSRYGHKLQFDTHGLASCPESGERYELFNGRVRLLTDQPS